MQEVARVILGPSNSSCTLEDNRSHKNEMIALEPEHTRRFWAAWHTMYDAFLQENQALNWIDLVSHGLALYQDLRGLPPSDDVYHHVINAVEKKLRQTEGPPPTVTSTRKGPGRT